MKKGFTLIELLAVIVILAIILLILAPAVIKTIDKAQKASFESSVQNLVKALEQKNLTERTSGSNGQVEVVFTNYEQTSPDKVELKGSSIKDGYAIITSSGDVTIVVTDGKYVIEKEPTSEALIIADFDSQNLEERYDEIATGTGGDTVEDAGGDTGGDTGGVIYQNNTPEVNATPCLIEGGEFSHIFDERDNNTYAVTKIGNQCWMAENLKYTTPECLEATWDIDAPHDGCRVNGGTGVNQAEVLYQWEAVMNGIPTEGSQGLCPAGWHVPTHYEWTDLEREICEQSGNTNCDTRFPKDKTNGWRGTDEGSQLKSTNPLWNGTNTFGFNAKPAGYRNFSNTLSDIGSYGYWWTSSSESGYAWRRHLYKFYNTINRVEDRKSSGVSVRCLLD